jgi:hypothetical protein
VLYLFLGVHTAASAFFPHHKPITCEDRASYPATPAGIFLACVKI